MYTRIVTLLSLALLFALGCGDGSKIVPVSGTITLDGEPLRGKSIEFIPSGDTRSTGAGGNTDENGHYELLAVKPGATTDVKGIAPGSYKVIVKEPIMPIDFPESDVNSQEPTVAVGIPTPKKGKRRSTIPALYSDINRTPLTATVPDNGGVIDFKLEISPKK